MSTLIVKMEKDCLCTANYNSKKWYWYDTEIQEKRKKYEKNHQKYLKYLKRCEKGSNNQKEKEKQIQSKHTHCKGFINHRFHCYSKEIVQIACELGVSEIIVLKHCDKDRRYKTNSFGAFNINWFYDKIKYKAKNAGLKVSIVTNDSFMKEPVWIIR